MSLDVKNMTYDVATVMCGDDLRTILSTDCAAYSSSNVGPDDSSLMSTAVDTVLDTLDSSVFCVNDDDDADTDNHLDIEVKQFHKRYSEVSEKLHADDCDLIRITELIKGLVLLSGYDKTTEFVSKLQYAHDVSLSSPALSTYLMSICLLLHCPRLPSHYFWSIVVHIYITNTSD